jgi:hypothetical protein
LLECHPGTAAWVQAFGALLALAIAIFVPVWTARRADRLAAKRFLGTVASISSEALRFLEDAATALAAEQGQIWSFARSVEATHRLGIISSALNAIPLHQLPTYELTESVLQLQILMSQAGMQFDAASKEVEAHGHLVQAAAYGNAFTQLARRARHHVGRIRAASR